MNVVKKILKLDLIIASCMFVVLVSTTFVGVIMRYVVNQPFTWLEEVQLMTFLWIVFLASGTAFRTGSHVAIEFIVDRFPRYIRILIECAIFIIVMYVLLYFLQESLNLVLQMKRIGRYTNILHIPYYFVYGIFPIGCVIMLVNYSYISMFNILSLYRSNKHCQEPKFKREYHDSKSV